MTDELQDYAKSWDRDEFWDSDGNRWHLTANGSIVRREEGEEPSAAVFARGDRWRAVSFMFDRFARGSRESPEEAAEMLIEAEAEGADSALWAPPSTTAWEPSKPKKGLPGFWRKQHGVILAVRQCPLHPSGGYPPSWRAFIGAGEAVLAASSQPWFRSADDAMMAADAEYERRASVPPGWR